MVAPAFKEFSALKKRSGTGIISLQRTRGPTRLHLNVLGRVGRSFFVLRIGTQQAFISNIETVGLLFICLGLFFLFSMFYLLQNDNRGVGAKT